MNAHDTLTLLACQIEIPPTQTAEARDRHLADSAEKVRDALADQQVDLVVLPELSSIEYSRAAFDRLDAISEPLDGPSFQTWRGVARDFGVFVAYSFARRDAAGTYITTAVVTPAGDLAGHYDKLHLCQYGASMEKEYFTPGAHVFTFRIREFTLAPIICYDIRIPELSRVLTLQHGVDVILHGGAYYRDESFRTWHDFATTRAMENQIFLLSLNRAGDTWGNSIFCWPWMDETLPPIHFDEMAEDFRTIRFTRDRLRRVRADYTFLADRRPDYTVL